MLLVNPILPSKAVFSFETPNGVQSLAASSSRCTSGIVMIRRMLQDQLDALAAGRDPIGVSFDPDAPPVEFEAGNYIREA